MRSGVQVLFVNYKAQFSCHMSLLCTIEGKFTIFEVTMACSDGDIWGHTIGTIACRGIILVNVGR
jgi:hypothetical protein